MSAGAMRQAERASPIIPGVSPMVYSEKDFSRIADLVRGEAGIVLNDKKRMLAYSRIAPLVRDSGSATFSEYLDRLGEDAAATTRTIEALTTNHTFFNREPHHFEHFTREVRPELLKRAEKGEPVRIWSAGCSTGEEIYTLMMTLLGQDRPDGRRIAKGDIIALATDLASHAVNGVRDAVYAEEAIGAMADGLDKVWSEPVKIDGVEKRKIAEPIRSMLRCRQLNLLGEWPFKGLFDVVFCRNVMIYFDGPTKDRLVHRLARQVKPGGYLYIGHSERIAGKGLEEVDLVGPTIYRRKTK